MWQQENSFIMLIFSHIWTITVQYGVMLKLDAVIKFQKRAARSILDKPLETPSPELFAELKWMEFPKRVMYQKAILMYKIMHNLTPPYLANIFKFSREVHDQTLRSTSENLLYVSKPNTKMFKNSIAYSGSKIWNSIPDNIRNAGSLQFKKGYLEWTIVQDNLMEVFLVVYKNVKSCLKLYFICLYICIYLIVCFVLTEDLREDWTSPTELPL